MDRTRTEEIINDCDHLVFSCNKEIKKIIKDEILLFSDDVYKINKFSSVQKRKLVITDKALYNFKQTMFKIELKRRFSIELIIGITTSTETNEFIIHGAEDEYDYYFESTRKKEIIKIIHNAYFKLVYKKLYLCLSHEPTIRRYVTLKKEKKMHPDFSKMDRSLSVTIDKYLDNIRLSELHPEIDKNKVMLISNNNPNIKNVKFEDFQIIHVVGRGTFGKVCCVEYLPTHEIFAMKCLRKIELIEQDQIENTLLEKDILKNIDHPFLCRLEFCFQDSERIFLVMPFINGGELFQHLKYFRRFEENNVKFYSAQIGLGLQYLHEKGIIYRDLKPENILMDELGYLRITDFGMSKKLKGKEKAMTFCGTPEYLAPEVISREGHDKTADWWSFGILIYEMLYGIPPFYDSNVEKMYELIKTATLKFPKSVKVSKEAKDLITKLLDRKIDTRLGSKNGFNDIRIQPFYEGFDFDLLLQKKIKAQFIPNLENKTDSRYFDNVFTKEETVMSLIPERNKDIILANQDKFDEF